MQEADSARRADAREDQSAIAPDAAAAGGGASGLGLGERLRSLRKSHALSLQLLSQRSDVSVGTLSQIERGLTQPSIRSLQKIGAALGVPLAWFFDESPAQESDGVVIRKGQGAKLKVASDGISKTLLTPESLSGLQLMLVEMKPHAISGQGSYVHSGLDAGVVLSGSLNLEVDGRVYVLIAGDSFGFDSSRPHRFENRGSAPAEVVWVNTQETASTRRAVTNGADED